METLAWSPKQFPRVALILAKLAHVPIPGNWGNSPKKSLLGLFRSWLPQTAASIEQRIATLDMLINKEPEIAFNLLDSLVNTYPDTATPASRPKWRNDDAGFGRGVTHEDYQKMQVAAADRLLTLAAMQPLRIVCLLEKISIFDEEYTEKTLDLLKPYANQDAPDEDKELIRNALRCSIHRDRNYSDKDEETLDKELNVIEQLYQCLEPRDLLIRHRWLFAHAWPHIHQRVKGLNLDKQTEIVTQLRFDAIKEIHFALGLDGIEKFTALCGDSYWVGVTVAGLDIAEDKLVKWIFDKSGDFAAENPFTRAVNGLLNRFDCSKALTITASVIDLGKISGWDANTIAQFLLLAPLCIEAWKTVENYGHEVINAYWSAFPSTYWGRDENTLDFVLQHLLAVNRPRSALQICQFDFHKSDAALIAEMLERFLHGEESDGPLLDSYRIGEALEYLQTSPIINKAQLLRLEFAFFPALGYGHEQQAKTLYEGIMSDPALFTQLLCILYKPLSDEHKHALTEVEKATAETAWQVLRACKRLPGLLTDGSIDPQIFTEFIDRTRELCRAEDRLEVCDSTLGEILAYAPQGQDNIWPCQPVRDYLDRNELVGMRYGFLIGLRNKRGVTMRLPDEGGGQERSLADYYRQQAQALSYTHINLAATLENLASDYEWDGQREDVDASLQKERF
ncbi:hypothetical protein [Methylocucumis oryzae]|uniref:hypothetical protein n=1 Tax=Methylocucumis oryzae TaxID=1632867 RepID=UPI00103BC892|nr:hypothetical protein [Methylocucumis oryzae]